MSACECHGCVKHRLSWQAWRDLNDALQPWLRAFIVCGLIVIAFSNGRSYEESSHPNRVCVETNAFAR